MLTLAQALPQDQVLVLADGKKYTFSEFHLNAQAAMQERYGVEFIPTMQDLTSADVGPSSAIGINDLGTFLAKNATKPAVMRFITWQLLRKYQRDLTEEDVGYLITMTNMADILQVITMSIVSSMPIPDEKKKELTDDLAKEVLKAKKSLSTTTGK